MSNSDTPLTDVTRPAVGPSGFGRLRKKRRCLSRFEDFAQDRSFLQSLSRKSGMVPRS